ncbi:MAG: hypothetical protein QGF90_09855 [Gammaproteobacteria bacterium]|jgi:hypothetical protein|nr:hypothetical protein [Gammaproteobacteria bacterium]
MKMSPARKIMAIVLIAVFSQVSLADNASATKTIAGVLVNLNHFPSDGQEAALQAVSSDESAGRGFQMIAAAVANLRHAATAADKEIMTRIIASDRTTAQAKALAEIVLGITHVPSDEAKAALQAML